jgi:hypothetical protein
MMAKKIAPLATATVLLGVIFPPSANASTITSSATGEPTSLIGSGTSRSAPPIGVGAGLAEHAVLNVFMNSLSSQKVPNGIFADGLEATFSNFRNVFNKEFAPSYSFDYSNITEEQVGAQKFWSIPIHGQKQNGTLLVVTSMDRNGDGKVTDFQFGGPLLHPNN